MMIAINALRAYRLLNLLGVAWGPLDPAQPKGLHGLVKGTARRHCYGAHIHQGKMAFPNLYHSRLWPCDYVLANEIEQMCYVTASGKLS